MTQDIDAFAREAREDFQGIFRSSHARDYLETSQENKVKQEAQALSMNAQGGEQHIGALLSDMYGPGFKTALVSWLESLVTYPKPFDFTLGRISDLVNFKESELFPSGDTYLVERWGCEAKKAAGELETDENTNEQYYTYQEEVIKPDGTVELVTKRKYCKYLSREELTKVIAQRRRALDKAISIYLEEVSRVPMSFLYVGQTSDLCVYVAFRFDAIRLVHGTTLCVHVYIRLHHIGLICSTSSPFTLADFSVPARFGQLRSILSCSVNAYRAVPT